MASNDHHPSEPCSNVSKISGFNPDNYALDDVRGVVRVHECLVPNRPPTLTMDSVGMFLQPLTRELTAVPPRPTVEELPDAVIEQLVKKEKAFWVDKPGDNAYVLHDAYRDYGMTTEKVSPHVQAVFPRSYQYDLECIKYRRMNSCKNKDPKKNTGECRDCKKQFQPDLASSQKSQDQGNKRWRDFPDFTVSMSPQQIREAMQNVGRPFQNEACNWYYEKYPMVKYECIQRKFAK